MRPCGFIKTEQYLPTKATPAIIKLFNVVNKIVCKHCAMKKNLEVSINKTKDIRNGKMEKIVAIKLLQ